MRLTLCLLLGCLVVTDAAAALDIERLPFATGARAGQPSVAVDPREGFVVTWQERETDGAVLRFAVIDDQGREARRGEIARGNDWFINGADFPSLAVLDNGDWVSFVLPKTSPGTYSYAIHTLRSRDAGASWDAPVVVHRDGTDTEHGFVSMQPAGDDVVRVVWLDGRLMAGADHDHHGGAEHMTLRSAALARDRPPFDEAELDNLTCACCQTSAARVDGRLRVVYRDRSADEVRDVYWVEHAAGRWSAPAPVHADGWTIAACPVNGPALAARGQDFGVLWPTMASGEMELKFATGRDRFEAPRTLASGPTELGRVAIAALPGGWITSRVIARERTTSILVERLDAEGTSVATAQLGRGIGGFPRLAVKDHTLLLVWAEAGDVAGSSRIGVGRGALTVP